MGRKRNKKHKKTHNQRYQQEDRHDAQFDARKKRARQLIYQIDLHHHTWEQALRRLKVAPREASHVNSRLIKIIHGWGRETGSNVLQKNVRRWLSSRPFSFRAIIEGESYSTLDKKTAEMRDEIGQFPDNDLNARNKGMTIVWLR